MQDAFPKDYHQARSTFGSLAERLGATLLRHQIAAGDDLSIDVAVFGEPAESTLVISSGMHGVEGSFGSAVQLAWMSQLMDQPPLQQRVVLIHAINPYGYANDRRWNEDNVDLNRNFVTADRWPTDEDSLYSQLDPLLNPPTLPHHWEAFHLKAAWYVARYGMPTIKAAITTGQYEFPRGIFFGGRELTESTRIVQQHYRRWVGETSQIVHLDLHTGLGSYGQYKLLIESESTSPSSRWFAAACGLEHVESSADNRTAYQAHGSFGSWASREMSDRDYHFATVEFGTYGALRILAALRNENRVFHYAKNRSSYDWVRDELRECFCPQDETWRSQVVGSALRVIRQCQQQFSTAERS